MSALRDRRDRCPGVWRPWLASDGLLVRLRLVGGHLPTQQLAALIEVAEKFGDGHVRLTSRANLQLRALPGTDNALDEDVADALESTGLLPTRTHELVRNVMISPQTGLAGGCADLRGVGQDLDRVLCGIDTLADLPGRFLFVLDDGRGDLLTRSCDLGLVALDDSTAQLRVGSRWGRTVRLTEAATEVARLAGRFVAVRGSHPAAPWHVDELPEELVEPREPDSRLPRPIPALAYGTVPGGRHVEVAEPGLDRRMFESLTADTATDTLIVTPWRGVLIPEAPR